MKRISKYFKRIFLLLGIAVFIYLIWQLGWENVYGSLRRVGWWWGPILLLALTWQICHTMAWREILKSLGYRPSTFRLLKLKFIADAVNMIAPSANLGGDVTRAYLVRKDIPLTAGISSVMVDKTLDAYVRIAFNIIGLIIAALFIDVPDAWLWAGVLVLVITFAGNGLLVALQIKGFSGSVKRFVGLIPPLKRKLEEQEDKLHTLADELREIYLKNPGQLFIAGLWHLTGRFLGLFEIWFILQLLEAPVNFTGTYFVTTVMNLIQSAFVLIPGQWGVAEGGQALLIQSLGYTAAIGLSLGVIRRIRKLTITGIGILIYWAQKDDKTVPADADALQ